MHIVPVLVRPRLQVKVQVPLAQLFVAFATLHTCPQAPQLLTFVVTMVSQPVLGFPSQLANPALQEATVHAPLEQPAVPFATKHWWLQAPQLLASVLTWVSQ